MAETRHQPGFGSQEPGPALPDAPTEENRKKEQQLLFEPEHTAALRLLAFESLIAGLEEALQERLQHAQDRDARAIADNKIHAVHVPPDPRPDRHFIGLTPRRSLRVCEQRARERTGRTARIVMLACVPCATLRTRLPDLQKFRPVRENIDGHGPDRQARRRLVRRRQTLDPDIVL